MPARKDTAAVNKSAATRETLPYDPVDWEQRLAIARKRRAEVLKLKQQQREAAPTSLQANAEQALDASRFRAVPFAAVTDRAPTERHETFEDAYAAASTQPGQAAPGFEPQARSEDNNFAAVPARRRSKGGMLFLAAGCFAAGIIAVQTFDLFTSRAPSVETPQPGPVAADSTGETEATTVSTPREQLAPTDLETAPATVTQNDQQADPVANSEPAGVAAIDDTVADPIENAPTAAPDVSAPIITAAPLGLVEPDEVAAPARTSNPTAPDIEPPSDIQTSAVAALGPQAADASEPTVPQDDTRSLAAQEPDETAGQEDPIDEAVSLAALSAESIGSSIADAFPSNTLTAAPQPRPQPNESITNETGATAPTADSADAAALPSDAGTPFDEIRAVIHVPRQTTGATVDNATAAIAGLGIPEAPPRTTGFNISQTHLRYYHPEDARAAQMLGDRIGAPVRDFTAHRPSPNVGLVEVWVAGTSPQPARTTPQPTIEPPAPVTAAAPPEPSAPAVPRQPKTISLTDLENVQRQVRDLMGELLPGTGN